MCARKHSYARKSFSNKELFSSKSISEIHITSREGRKRLLTRKGRIKRIKEEIIFPTIKIHFFLPFVSTEDSSSLSPIEAPVTERRSIRNEAGRELQDKRETKAKDQRPVLESFRSFARNKRGR